MNLLAFDIETVPDVEAGARQYGIDAGSAAEVDQKLREIRLEEAGTDFLRHHLHQVVAISVVMRREDWVRVWFLGTLDSDERDLVSRFFEGIERYTPQLISWNGSGFDLPVLHYRAMRHTLSAPRYWAGGEDDPGFRYNSYVNRYHERHTDVMDVLSAFQPRASVGLDALAGLLGFPEIGRAHV